MSMLTPPGMGGKYRITGDKYPRMRRGRRRSRIVLAVVSVAAVLGLIGWGSLQLIDVFTGSDKANAAGAGPVCATPSPKASASSGTATTAAKAHGTLPKPAKIKVNVLNATSRSGLAQDTADELKKRGFTIGDVGNATKQYDKKIKGVGMLLGPTTAMDTSLPVLGTQLAGAEMRADTRKGKDVDLVIGTGFKKLTKKAAADKALDALAHPAPSPSPSGHC